MLIVMGIATQPHWVFQHQLQTLFMLLATCLDIQSQMPMEILQLLPTSHILFPLPAELE